MAGGSCCSSGCCGDLNTADLSKSIGYSEEELSSIDVIISNCLINLAPDKEKVFREAFRVLKPGGAMYISDMVLLEELPEDLKNDKGLLVSCLAGALLKQDYLSLLNKAGFSVEILNEDLDISKRQYSGLPAESLKLKAWK